MATPFPIGSDSPITLSSESTPTTSQAPVVAPKQQHRRRIYRPAKDSLYDLFHEHAGTSLFVRPISWTDLHAQLLGTRWEKLPPCDSPKPATMPKQSPSKGHLLPSHTIMTLSNSLTQIFSTHAKQPILCSDAVKTVLMTLWPQPFSESHSLPKLHLYFGGRIYRDAVGAQIMWNFPSDESKSSFCSVSTQPADSCNAPAHPSNPSLQGPANLPMMCYVGKSQLANIRKNLLRIRLGPGKSRNEPVYRLQQLRAKLLVPSNSDHDANFVGIFLAMAQKHFYPSPPPLSQRESPRTEKRNIPPSPNFQDVTLRILTHETYTSEFIVYTGYVTKEFLEKFHNPFKAPEGEEKMELSGIKIEFTRVPISPILGLRERLGKALGQDMVGYFNHEEMETWVKDLEKQESGKRKRDGLLAALNSTFDKESAEEASLGSKKRCLTEGSLVGVVI
ncbi:hypothetical protein BGZ61DRAFT_364379 [Ilyonectria robusta]|uniref:uncharacterized protein n=1 Tax=Ilyonectria robusta TaxID=1079257 RepID=UPI001E8E9B41|nr:uncharacterized protein BGZ61DRAFT_364379 [Ilyonectria robusta]KAH8669262.1 hypothetical protein BGZ61DRAFT_364379 [Ilyonectria robusta]